MNEDNKTILLIVLVILVVLLSIENCSQSERITDLQFRVRELEQRK